MIPLSCVNCSYNALQYDSIGTSVGFCTEHRKILQVPSELSCGRLLRKDLLYPRAQQERDVHQRFFSPALISSLRTRSPANGRSTSSAKKELCILARDPVSAAVADYGQLGTKIESLAKLSAIAGVRPEVARLTLSRPYVARCVERNGTWTSGLHLLWWTREELAEEPKIAIEDIRVEMALPLSRQIDLAKWSVLMLRLIFVSDIGHHAKNTDRKVARLHCLAEDAASETQKLSFGVLLRWVKKHAIPRFDKVLPRSRYEKLSAELHRESEDAG